MCIRDSPLPYVLTNCHNSLCAVGGTINEDDQDVYKRQVLGVLRRHAKSPFWGPVSRRADVRLLPLTVENRAEIPTELARLLG